ncbi:MAG: helix-turn-helix transcriptional regulator [Burkholderiaceae bacterium]|nr:helix-turn-helix transcriptional regulator [Burkholderiaceae bacterium]
MKIDFTNSPLAPEESRAARNYFGLSQAQAAAKSNLPAHKLKRFESGNYVPDSEFLQALRDFFEGEGYNFHDENAPGAKAKARGDIFQAGVVGDTSDSTGETGGSPSGKPGKLPRPQTANLQFMRITPTLESDQVDRVFDCIEDNEAAVLGDAGQPINTGFLSDSPSAASQATAVALLRRLAENGLLYARLMGRELLPVVKGDEAGKASSAETVGELLSLAMSDLQLAVIDGDKKAQERRKARVQPVEVLQALVG